MTDELFNGFQAGFTALPRRCLFCNECVRVMLTGLRAGQSVAGVAPPQPLVLLVTFGAMRLEAGGEVFTACEGQMLVLNPRVAFRLFAAEAADFLVLCQSCPARQAALKSFTETLSSGLASGSAKDTSRGSNRTSRETRN